MIVLVATKNIDKFNTTKGIFQKLGLSNYIFKHLRDYKIESENDEVGTLRERARDKVEFAIKMLGDNDELKDIKVVVGIDDGFYVPKRNLLTANSKELVDEILSGKMLNTGDIIEEVRSYAIHNLESEKYYYYESRLPLKYLGYEKGIKREEGSNPLKNVLSFEHESKPIGSHNQDEIDKVILMYVKDELGVVLSELVR